VTSEFEVKALRGADRVTDLATRHDTFARLHWKSPKPTEPKRTARASVEPSELVQGVELQELVGKVLTLQRDWLDIPAQLIPTRSTLIYSLRHAIDTHTRDANESPSQDVVLLLSLLRISIEIEVESSQESVIVVGPSGSSQPAKIDHEAWLCWRDTANAVARLSYKDLSEALLECLWTSYPGYQPSGRELIEILPWNWVSKFFFRYRVAEVDRVMTALSEGSRPLFWQVFACRKTQPR
jgi:hypothetical protein